MSKKIVASSYLNPPFDPRMLSIGVPAYGGTKLQRGRIVRAEKGADKVGVHFLYNPLEITASHNLNPDAVFNNDAQKAQAAGVTTGNLLNLGDVGASLLYDRTYELWHKRTDNLASKLGCYADVWAFYQMLGIAGKGHYSQTRNGGRFMPKPSAQAFNSNTWTSLLPSSPLAPVLVYLIIGDKLRFYGMVSSFSVTYSHWSKDMIPIRCAIDISISFQPDPPSTAIRVKDKKGKAHKVGAQP